MSGYNDYLEWYRRLPPERRADVAARQVARIEKRLMVALQPDERPDWAEAAWLRNIPAGPSLEGIAQLTAAQEEFGSVNVTTGDARPPSVEAIGLYVREDVLAGEGEGNFLRSYLSG